MDTISEKEGGINQYASKESSKHTEDIEVIWEYVRDWSTVVRPDLTTLIQDIVDARHADDEDLARLCVDSPILDDDVYEWLSNDQLFNEMQLYRKKIERADSLTAHHEAVRVLMQLQAYLHDSPAVSSDIEKVFRRIATKP